MLYFSWTNRSNHLSNFANYIIGAPKRPIVYVLLKLKLINWSIQIFKVCVDSFILLFFLFIYITLFFSLFP